MPKLPLVSFITVCYNGYADTCDLIESIQKYISSIAYEIIVIDNASKNDEASLLKDRYPFILAHRSPVNLGFAGGNNLGIERASGKYLFFINNDTYISDDGIMHLIKRLDKKETIGGVSPKIKFAVPPYDVQFAGFTRLSRITLRNEIIGYGVPDSEVFNTPTQLPYLHGAAMLIKREVIDKAGPMPEIYFLYYEELDWCTKIRNAGYELWYEPQWTIYHKESKSTGHLTPLRIFYMTRNRLLYAWRNRKGLTRLGSIAYQLLFVIPSKCILFLLKGKTDLTHASMKAIWAFFKLPQKIDHN